MHLKPQRKEKLCDLHQRDSATGGTGGNIIGAAGMPVKHSASIIEHVILFQHVSLKNPTPIYKTVAFLLVHDGYFNFNTAEAVSPCLSTYSCGAAASYIATALLVPGTVVRCLNNQNVLCRLCRDRSCGDWKQTEDYSTC